MGIKSYKKIKNAKRNIAWGMCQKMLVYSSGARVLGGFIMHTNRTAGANAVVVKMYLKMQLSVELQ